MVSQRFTGVLGTEAALGARCRETGVDNGRLDPEPWVAFPPAGKGEWRPVEGGVSKQNGGCTFRKTASGGIRGQDFTPVLTVLSGSVVDSWVRRR